MTGPIEIVSVDAENLAERGCFCRKGKMKTVGNLRKLAWATEELANGLRIEILYEGGRSTGFVEYAPYEHAWRAIHAPRYIVLHCIWVLGRAQGKGYGSALLERVEQRARDRGATGVAMVTSRDVWPATTGLLLRHGYQPVDKAPPSFELMAKSFGGAAMPAFPTNWEERAAAFGTGVTIVTTDQCPYFDDAEQAIAANAMKLGLPVAITKLGSAGAVQKRSPTAYGVFGVVLDGELLSHHDQLTKDLHGLLVGRT